MVVSESQVDQEKSAYPPGTIVAVHYNPANPKEAFLEGHSVSITSDAVGTAVWIGLGLSLLSAYVWDKRRKATSPDGTRGNTAPST